MGCARYIGEVVRRHPVKVLCVVALLVSFLVILGASLCTAPSPMPSFQFLGGRSPVQTIRDQDTVLGWGRDSLDYYSFVGDFRSVYAAAESELTALGYVKVTSWFLGFLDRFSSMRMYRLSLGPSGEAITVQILRSKRLVVFSTPKNSQCSSPDPYEYRLEDGWVSVEVCVHRNPSWLQVHVVHPVSWLLWKMGLYKEE